MSLSTMKRDLHNRLWNAQQRWFALRGQTTKHELKLRGLRESGDANHYTRNLIFTGSTKRAIEETLKTFVEFAHDRFGVDRLEDLGRHEFKGFVEDGIAHGLAARTLEARCSHLAKLGALIGRSEEFFAQSRRWAGHIRELARQGTLKDPARPTPSPDVVTRAVEILRSWDQRQTARTGHPRAYHLAARLQVETAGRSVSVTERLTRDSLKGNSTLEIIGKGGRPVLIQVPSDLYAAIGQQLERAGEALADRRGYQMAWRRALRAAGGRATGTHGLRRLAARKIYRDTYWKLIIAGSTHEEARRKAREEAVARLGHSRHRTDQAACYLGSVA